MKPAHLLFTILSIVLTIIYIVVALFTWQAVEGSKTYQGQRFRSLRCLFWGMIWPITLMIMIINEI